MSVSFVGLLVTAIAFMCEFTLSIAYLGNVNVLCTVDVSCSSANQGIGRSLSVSQFSSWGMALRCLIMLRSNHFAYVASGVSTQAELCILTSFAVRV